MRGKQRNFYADNQDIMNLLNDFDSLGQFKYVEFYSRLNKETDIFYNAIDIFDKAICTPQKTERRHSFSIFEIDAKIAFSNVILVDGSGKRIALETLLSDDSIEIHFGGEVGDNTLVISDIGTVADDKAMLDHFKRFKKLIEAKSVRIGPPGQPSYLMPGAVEKAKQGWRLAQGKGFNKNSDPVLPPEQLAKL
jgi:hypothetical protein